MLSRLHWDWRLAREDLKKTSAGFLLASRLPLERKLELFKQGLGCPSRVWRFQAITLKVYISVSCGPQPWHFRHLSCHRSFWSTLSCRKQSGLLIAFLALLGQDLFMNELQGHIQKAITASCLENKPLPDRVVSIAVRELLWFEGDGAKILGWVEDSGWDCPLERAY